MSELNFPSLFTENGGPDQGPQQKPTESPQNDLEQQQAPTLYRQAQRTQEAQKREADLYKEYQDNGRLVEGLKTEILKGIPEGKDLSILLGWALDAVGKLTHDEVFYTQAKRDLGIIYGLALKEPGPLQQEAEAARDRLERIRAACILEPDTGARSRMEAAIRAHEDLIARLQGQPQTQGDKLEVERLRLDADKGEFVPIEDN